jgi:hypothetical protein
VNPPSLSTHNEGYRLPRLRALSGGLSRRQDGVLMSQEETIERQVELLESRDTTIAQQEIDIEELGLKAAATTKLTIAFGD